MKKIITSAILLLLLVGCGTSSVPVTDTSKSLIELTDVELTQAVERYYQMMMSDGRTVGITAYGIKATVFQNEQLRRLLETK